MSICEYNLRKMIHELNNKKESKKKFTPKSKMSL